MKKVLIASTIILLIFSLASCRSQKVNTVSVHDTITIEVPSSTIIGKPTVKDAIKDTIVIQNNRVITKLHINKDTIYVNSTAKPYEVTKYVTKRVQLKCPTFTYMDGIKEYWYWLVVSFSLGVVVFNLRKK